MARESGGKCWYVRGEEGKNAIEGATWDDVSCRVRKRKRKRMEVKDGVPASAGIDSRQQPIHGRFYWPGVCACEDRAGG